MAGEMFVASECFRREWECSITLGNSKKVDLHVFNKGTNNRPGTNKGYTIDVKATRSGSWRITKKKIGPVSRLTNHFYVLVHYQGKFKEHMTDRPNCYIVPAKEIKKLITEGGVEGQQIEWKTVRNTKYEENWNLIIQGGKRPQKSSIYGKPKKSTCSRCGKTGHNKSNCKVPKSSLRRCSTCRKPGHNKLSCESNS